MEHTPTKCVTCDKPARVCVSCMTTHSNEEFKSLKAQLGAIKKAANGLRNMCKGMLGMEEMALRALLRHTNIGCLIHWIEEVEKAIALCEASDLSAKGTDDIAEAGKALGERIDAFKSILGEGNDKP